MISDGKLIANNAGINYKSTRRIVLVNNAVDISIGNCIFDGNQIRLLLGKLNYIIRRYGKKCRYINLISNCFLPKDKMTYIIFEIIIYELIAIYGKDVNLVFKDIKYNINTQKKYILNNY